MHVIFNHGKESGPWGTKIRALADVAKSLDCSVESLDYQGQHDADKRVAQLQQAINKQPPHDLVLVGSSMGGYVATAVAGQTMCRGLFVLAPAYYLGGYTDLDELTLNCPVTIVHGWRDDIVPVANSWKFAQQIHADLHVLDDDHRLTATLPQTVALFERFITSLQTGG